MISGDTAPSDAVVEACHGCNVLVHEVYSDSGFARRPASGSVITSASHFIKETSGNRDQARPGLLVLYHQLFWGTSEEDLLKEVPSVYSGKLVSGVLERTD